MIINFSKTAVEETANQLEAHMTTDKSVITKVPVRERKVEETEKQKNENETFLISAEELLNNKHEEVPKLIDPILPKVGLAAMSGGSDTGKSSLLRQLVTSIVLGKNDFIGFKINAEHKSAIYVSTEDGEDAMGFLLGKQNVNKEESSKFKGLDFIFDTDNLLEKLDAALKKKPADCVIIDAFADLFSGDLNATNKVRSNLNEYGLLANKHKCLFIFLHHTGKGKEDLTPSKNNLLGSQGFEAKMRLVMELRKDNSDPCIRHLCLVKGNYLASEYKQNSYVLKFDENMVFTYLNCRIPFNDLKKPYESVGQAKALESKISELVVQGLSGRKIADKLKKAGMRIGKSKVAEQVKRIKKSRPSVQNPIKTDSGQSNIISTID